jgi:hypothetical protein
MRVLVDSSVLLDILTEDPHWAAWSEEKLAAHAERERHYPIFISVRMLLPKG